MADRLSEDDLAAIEQRVDDAPGWVKTMTFECRDIAALVAEVRALQRERDEGRASFMTLFATTRRYREALEEIRERRADVAERGAWIKWAQSLASAALAAPGAGEGGEA